LKMLYPIRRSSGLSIELWLDSETIVDERVCQLQARLM
jgi:hypothetical protein